MAQLLASPEPATEKYVEPVYSPPRTYTVTPPLALPKAVPSEQGDASEQVLPVPFGAAKK